MSKPVTPARRRRLLMRRWVPFALLAVGCALSAAAALYEFRAIEARTTAEFVTAANETGREIEVRVTGYVELLRAATALLSASNETNHADFRAFVRNLDLRNRYPGVGGIGFAQRIRRQDLRSAIRAIELDGVTNLKVWPHVDAPDYFPILFLEPLDASQREAIGFDVRTDPVRRAAMEQARDSGQPVLSSKLTVVQAFERERPASFVLFVPVYRTGASIQTVEQRRRALVGFVFSPFHPVDLFDGVVPSRSRVRFEVYDGSVSESALLHASGPPDGVPEHRSTRMMRIAGREWAVIVTSVGAAEGWPKTAKDMLLGGLLLSVMLFVMTLVQVGAWEAAVRHQTEIEASERALRESESQLRDLVVREREARTQAQAADRSKDEFLATLSHELRTPLNAVLGWLTMLRGGSIPESRRAHALEVIERNARLQAQLIGDLLDVSRIITGKMSLECRPMSVASVVTAVVDSLRPIADDRGVRLTAAVPAGAGAIRGDAARVHQIVWNLLSNAIKFTPRGGEVSVALTEDRGEVELSVYDTGIGIAPEFLPHVFERFRQADSSTTRSHTGVGLGLAITRHLVQLHGGSITVHSDGPNRGSLFVVRLPSAQASAGGSRDRTQPQNVPSPRLEGVRVLVVDDDADTRELLSEALGASGAEVTTAESAGRALAELSRRPADVLISDIGMPGEDGLSLIRRIRTTPGDSGRIPAIALTAYATDAAREQALRAGYQIHFAKPVEIAALRAELAKLAAQYSGSPHASDEAAT